MTASTNPLTDSPGEGPSALDATDTVSAGLIRVALDLPLPRLFDYLCPGVSSNDLGRRVVVPFGRKQMLGLIAELPTVSDMDTAKLRPADTVLRDIPALGADWLALAQFCASYYQKPLGEVVMNALPPRLRRVQALAAPALRAIRIRSSSWASIAVICRSRSSAEMPWPWVVT